MLARVCRSIVAASAPLASPIFLALLHLLLEHAYSIADDMYAYGWAVRTTAWSISTTVRWTHSVCPRMRCFIIRGGVWALLSA